ncbi:hypothetical protein Emed_005018 [Eimeria media]
MDVNKYTTPMRAARAAATALAVFGALGLETHAAAETGMGAPLMLSSLLSSSSHSWRRLEGLEPREKATSSSLFDQLPHVAPALASEDEAVIQKKPAKVYRDQYKPVDFTVESIDLKFELDEVNTKVTSNIRIRRRAGTPHQDLLLDGDSLQLQEVFLNGSQLVADAVTGYTLLPDEKLRIPKEILPADASLFEVQTLVVTNPKENLQLMGLFLTGDMLVTQCESAGFRRITYFLDRPDVLTRFRVRLEADKQKFPVLLSNGNKLAEGPLEEDPSRHFAVFEDPFLKPSYLFAIVAGKLGVLKDSFRTMSGRDVTLQLFTSPSNVHKLELPRDILKQSMRFDEEHFGREYDLDVLNVVCVNDFNGGAMENKGLIIFNCDALLADPATTTASSPFSMLSRCDCTVFSRCDALCLLRDWFEVTLKEGLSTFREELFSATVGSPAVTRIEKMKFMLSHQFKEDAGPMAHPIRPESYAAVDNLYTMTVYRKGAEVHRMYQTILGEEGFRKGMDLFFDRHDGSAVTSEDFRAAMEDANNVDLSQFALWYSQAGTPHVRVENASYDPALKKFSLTLSQHTPPTPGQPEKLPQVIPMKIGLVGKKSKTDLLTPPTKVVLLKKETETVEFFNISEDCVPSLFRDFSAPIKLLYEQSPEDLAFLMAHDSDPVNKSIAAQKLATSIIVARAFALVNNPSAQLAPLPQMFVDALKTTLLDKKTDQFVKALTLNIPELNALEQEMNPADPEALHHARRSVLMDVASALKEEMVALYNQLTVNEVERFDQKSQGRRRLRNELLMFLSEFRDREAAARAYKQFSTAKCMTDKFYSLLALSGMQQPEREQAFNAFYQEAKGERTLGKFEQDGSHQTTKLDLNAQSLHSLLFVLCAEDPQVYGNYLQLQALSDLPSQVERVEELQHDPLFSEKNPNCLRQLFGEFAQSSHHFHRKDGKGYKLYADMLLKVDKFNKMYCGKLAKLLTPSQHLEPERKALLQQQLRRILAEPTISDHLREIIAKSADSDA